MRSETAHESLGSLEYFWPRWLLTCIPMSHLDSPSLTIPIGVSDCLARGLSEWDFQANPCQRWTIRRYLLMVHPDHFIPIEDPVQIGIEKYLPFALLLWHGVISTSSLNCDNAAEHSCSFATLLVFMCFYEVATIWTWITQVRQL
jgi:hypothetical protein